MERLVPSLTLIGFLACSGCGSHVAEESSPTSTQVLAHQIDPNPAVQADSPSPVDVVSQFLDEVRRGGEDSLANDLLTDRARAELKKIGRSIQPIGSPDARFVVTRAENVPGEPDSALVHSVWTEPTGDGTDTEFQVVWAVHQESDGWRISGLAMQLDANQDPVIIDFENGEMMTKLLAGPDASAEDSSQIESQAAKNGTISR